MSTTELLNAQRDLGSRISRFLTNFKKTGEKNITLALLKRRQALLEQYWQEFCARHREIVMKVDKAESYLTSDYFTTTEDEYLNQGAVIDEWIATMTPSTAATPSNHPPSSGEPEPSLPQLNLPTFAGDLSEWESFRDRFVSLVHKSSKMSKVRKLEYLMSCLTGEAAKMLARTPITDGNYDGAWASLEKRFGNRRVLSAAHMRRIINVPSATKATPSEIKRLLDEFRQTMESFKALDKPVNEWDEWFLFLLVEKLDQTTRLAWEVSLTDPLAIPRFEMLATFLENRVHALSSARTTETIPTPKPVSSGRPSGNPVSRTTMAVKVDDSRKAKFNRQCPLCAGGHALGSCKKYKNMTSSERRDFVRKSGVCFSCLVSGHQMQNCTSNFRCWVCGDVHHTTLHDACSKGNEEKRSKSPVPTCSSYAVSSRSVTLLATARVLLEGPDGRTLNVRALLDSGSECSFLSEWSAQTLRLRRRSVCVNLTGYQGTKVGTARSEASVELRSPVNKEFRISLQALVTKSLTAPTPSHPLENGDWDHIKGLPLADPSFNLPGSVDVLLGADVCGQLLQDRREGPPGTPTAVLTPFGWTLMGPTRLSEPGRTARVLHVRRHELPDLQSFWELEEVPMVTHLTPDELKCERLFQDTTVRNSSGRYVVRLPFRTTPPQVGTTRTAALRMLLSVERRQQRDPILCQSYVDFMEEYHRLGHMVAAPGPLAIEENGCYIPHHAVWKNSEGQRKIRVVFNASNVTSGGSSLNDALLPGPKLQADLWAVVTRWRLFRLAFSADIVKMFRQILIHPDDQDWLRILWRKHPGERVTDYRLTTVTYGTAPAPYLAHRVLRQLASDEENQFPLASQVLRENTYVDDILAGADNAEDAWKIQGELIDILASAGFPLDKWASSDGRIRSPLVDHKMFQELEVHGALGLRWDTVHDTLSVRGSIVEDVNQDASWTKRTILSEIARLFNPMGWLTPVFIVAKVLLQDFWLAGVTWDEVIGPTLAQRWTRFRQELPLLDGITVPRWTQFSPEGCSVEIHGFCDASERAYAAAAYLVVRRSTETTVSLLMAKSRVAPTKTTSIPRLELCGAVLLVRLLANLKGKLGWSEIPTLAWSDSTVVLAWIRAHPSRWKPFVAHRVAEIQGEPGICWRHVGTHDNPADLATRGISSQELCHADLWWSGPSWITEPADQWPVSSVQEPPNHLPEERQTIVTLSTTVREENPYLLRFSHLDRLIRVTAQVRRFLSRARRTELSQPEFLTTSELREALFVAVRLSQQDSFADDLERLRRGIAISASSSLKSLCPFLDKDGILRVEGRLKNTYLAEARRHPMIVGRNSHLATLIIRDGHFKTLHGRVNATSAWIHRAFWIPRCRVRVKQILHDCVTCVRLRASPGQQRMGNLPVARLQPAKPFLRAGVDYAGPFALRTAKGRGHKSQKGYVVVFVCMVTKAVHLDAVTDLSSPAFLAAFHRFTARRGHCAQMFSDNATTFRGANGLLNQLFKASSQFYQSVAETLANEGTEWTFIPPYSPHMGGLWEAAVKSMKTHLRKTIGDATLTYEEMATLLCRVEACLNSRPLTPLPDEPRDLEPLTPGHFLVGDRLLSPPEPPADHCTVPLTSRWKLLHNMLSHFWHR